MAAATLAAAVLTAILIGLAMNGDARKAAPPRARHRSESPTAVLPVRQRAPLLHRTGTVARITLGAPVMKVPRSYFGLSTEYWALPPFERSMMRLERVLGLLHWPGDQPLTLRIGGDSADHAIFDPNLSRLPNALFELTPAWFRQMSTIVNVTSAQLILDLNLVVDRPEMALLWARAAEAQLPRGSVTAYEIGNEPDLYDPVYWSHVFGPFARLLGLRLFTSLTPDLYDELYARYADVLSRFAPGVPLMAPVVAYPTLHFEWLRTFLSAPRKGLGIVSAHMYPYSACAPPGTPDYPTVAKLLSEDATAGMATSLVPAIALAHGKGLPFRLTEVNSVTCGGVAGVSDRFVTALWAPDALFELLRRGVNGIDVHVRAYAINAAFAVGPGGVVARPLLYGLILFVRSLGPGAELMQLRLSAGPRVHLKAWAVRVSGGILHVLLINKGNHTVNAHLALPATGVATLQRLLAPSVTARSGVTLGGQRIGPQDTWEGRPADEAIARANGEYDLGVPAYSAALLSLHLTS